MGRKITFNNAANNFVQGLNANNVGVHLVMLGGNDKVNLNRDDDLGGRCRVEAGAGNDTVVAQDEDGNVIFLGAGNDTYAGLGFAFSIERADTVHGGLGNDTIGATTSKSLYFGDGGNDTFISSGQRNDFVGGAGIDTISYSERDFTNRAGEGVTIDLGAGQVQTGPIAIETVSGIENAEGSSADDLLFGSSGANVLRGAGGFDEMTGRGGADRFVFAKVTDAVAGDELTDLVLDFSAAQGDRIDLRQIDARSDISGNQAFTFIGTANFDGRKGLVHFRVLSDGVLLEVDRNGDQTADMQIGLIDIFSFNAGLILL